MFEFTAQLTLTVFLGTLIYHYKQKFYKWFDSVFDKDF